MIFFVFLLFSTSFLLQFDRNEITVSGISSGGFFASQLHISYSSQVKAAAIFAAGPYFCSKGNFTHALKFCMSQSTKEVDLDPLFEFIQTAASKDLIDSLENVRNSRVFIFSGLHDVVVSPSVVKKTEEFYFRLGAAIESEYLPDANHVFPTENNGEKCDELGKTFIGKCKFNGAKKSLDWFYPNLKPAAAKMKQKNLFIFNQIQFQQKCPLCSFAKEGYIYIPTTCQQNEECRFHVSFHGCKQSFEEIGSAYITELGFNEIAESNDIIIFYPQLESAKYNPMGCWDWWGYSEKSAGENLFPTKKGPQITAINEMIDKLRQIKYSSELNVFHEKKTDL